MFDKPRGWLLNRTSQNISINYIYYYLTLLKIHATYFVFLCFSYIYKCLLSTVIGSQTFHIDTKPVNKTSQIASQIVISFR